MGYKNAVIREEFPDLFEGAFVEIWNPAQMPTSKVRAIQAEVGENVPAEEMGRQLVCRLVKDWNLPAAHDPSDAVLPIPPSPADMERLPSEVYVWLINAARPVPNGKAPNGKASAKPSRGKRR